MDSVGKLDICWSSINSEQFVTWNRDISLYECVAVNERSFTNDGIIVSPTTVAKLITKETSNNSTIKCLDIYPGADNNISLAAGQTCGKVYLTTLDSKNSGSVNFSGIEFIPKVSRSCNVVAWNKSDVRLLAGGFDRARNDYCLKIWDVTLARTSDSASNFIIAETGISDSVHSFTWLNNTPRVFAFGVSFKAIRITDLRDVTKIASICATKAVFGVSVSPISDNQLASFTENQIYLWDLRYFEKPIVVINQPKSIAKISWNQKNNLLSIERESDSVVIHTIHPQSEDCEISVSERRIYPPFFDHNKEKLSVRPSLLSFSIHPTICNRILAVNIKGNISDFTVPHKNLAAWKTNLAFTNGSKQITYFPAKSNLYQKISDTSIITKERISNNYGLRPHLRDNAIDTDDEQIKFAWYWLDHCKYLVEEGQVQSPISTYPGVCTILEISDSTTNELHEPSELISYSALNSTTLNMYRSSARDKALKLCGWQFFNDNAVLEETVTFLTNQGHIAKAAAYAAFTLNLKEAINILSKDVQYNTVAMALSGYTPNKGFWRDSCKNALANFNDHYLRAMFLFLTSDNDNYDLVLKEDKLELNDRLGFALIFLNDIKLINFIEMVTEEISFKGELFSILLLGMTKEIIPVFQRYIDITSDLQTVVLLLVRTMAPVLLETEILIKSWIDSYRELLNNWKMWKERALFDICLGSISLEKPPTQVYLCCNYCGRNISGSGTVNKQPTSYSRQPPTSSHSIKATCCPFCKRPTPRCVICLSNMGTPTHPGSIDRLCSKPILDDWYTWCQTCRHGGHVRHIMQWFKENMECPVSSCTCKCALLDIPDVSDLSQMTLS